MKKIETVGEGKKLEISNICFLSFSKKKKYIFQQNLKKKILGLHIQNLNPKKLGWDGERKLFSYFIENIK